MYQKENPDALSSLLSDLDVGSDVFSRPKTLHGMRNAYNNGMNTSQDVISSSNDDSGIQNEGQFPEHSTAPPSHEHRLDELEHMMMMHQTDTRHPTPTAATTIPMESSEEQASQWEDNTTTTDAAVDPWMVSMGFETNQTTKRDERMDDDASMPWSSTETHRKAEQSINDPFAEFTMPTSSSQALLLGDDGFGNSSFVGGSQAVGGGGEMWKGVDGASEGVTDRASSHIGDTFLIPPTSDAEKDEERIGRMESFGLNVVGQNATSDTIETQQDGDSDDNERRKAHKVFQILDMHENKSREKGHRSHKSRSHRNRRSLEFENGSNLEDSIPGRRRRERYIDTALAYESSDRKHDGDHHHGASTGRGGDVVAEVGHRAAKAFQVGTKWLMKASRQLAKDVQGQIEKRLHHQHDRSLTDFDDDALEHTKRTNLPTFYYDWATQLIQMTPRSRASALLAMDESDRSIMQDLMDEAALGEATLNSLDDSAGIRMEDHVSDSPTNFNDDKPEPPSYDEVMGSRRYDLRVQEKTEHMQMASKGKVASGPYSQGSEGFENDGNHDLLNLKSDVPPRSTSADSSRPDAPVVHHDDSFGGGITVAVHHEKQASLADDSADLLGLDGGHAPGDFESMPATVGKEESESYMSEISHMFSETVVDTVAYSIDTKRSTGTGFPDLIGGFDQGPAVDIDIHGFEDLYTGDGNKAISNDANEPELRRQARERRIAARNERMRRQLAEKRALEEAEAAEKSNKVTLREQYRPRIEAWISGRKDNIRALLSTLHTVLWEDSGWKQPSIADMVEPGQVKRWYMKANLVVHPDKVKQKGGTIEQVTIADMVFDILKSAWGKFEEQTRS